MYNPDFWEIILGQSDLEQIPDYRGIWFESSDDREDRYEIEERNLDLAQSVYHSILGSLTEKQREAVMLYFEYGKTQQEISAILGMSRRQPALVRHHAKRKMYRRGCQEDAESLQQDRYFDRILTNASLRSASAPGKHVDSSVGS